MHDTNSLRAWYIEDIAKMLVSIHAAAHVNSVEGANLRGFDAALGCVALAVGLKPTEIFSAQNGELCNPNNE